MNEDVKSENVRIHSRADELIACLEGEIAKRDAQIVELQRYEHAFNEWHDKTEWVQAESATLSAKYLGCHRADVMRSLIDDLREELAACRVAVENCEVFRARIAELEAKYLELASLSSRISVELPIAYALPVSEAKAQGVVMPDCCATVQQVSDDELLEVACHHGNGNKARRRAEAIAAQARLGSAILNADGYVRAPVEPTEDMVFAGCAALVGSIGGYEAGLVERCYDAMLAAAPAAPAADAGLVDALGYQVLFDAIAAATSVYANGAVNISVQAFRDALAAHRAKGVV